MGVIFGCGRIVEPLSRAVGNDMGSEYIHTMMDAVW